LFEKLKESVWLSRRKIRKCTVKKKDHAETRISWNSIWNELKKTDWCASEELTQRLKVWYSFSEPSDMASERPEKRDLSHTLPAFMIESLVHSEDRWDQEPSTEITSTKKDSVPDKSNKERLGKSIQQQINVAQAQQVSLESVPSSSEVYRTERRNMDQSLNSFDSHGRWSPPKLSRLNHLAPEFTPAKANISPSYKTNLKSTHSNQKYEIQSKTVVKEHWCPPARPPQSERISIFVPRSPRETFTQRRVEHWDSENMETKSFRGKQAYPFHETFTQRNVQKRTSEEQKTKVLTSKLGAQTRSSYQDFQFRHKHSNANYQSTPTSCVRGESPRDKRKVFGQENPNPNHHHVSVHSCKTKPIYHRRNRCVSWKKKSKYFSPSKEVPIKPESPVFPPKGYIYEKGDWVVHAIVSLSSKPEDVTLALEKRGYKLKHILKRKCNLPNKWVCSLIASADRTHILTSENIWLNSWEVEFVCSEEEIAPFLGSPK